MYTKSWSIFTLLIFLLFSCASGDEHNDVELSSQSSEESSDQHQHEAIQEEGNQTNPSSNPQPTASKADYQEYYESGKLKIEGNYDANNQRHGLWVSYYENGQKWSESVYKNGLKNGHSITFFPNGNVRYVGDYKEDKKTGTWTFYNETGEVSSEETY